MKAEQSKAPAVAMPSGNPLAISTLAAGTTPVSVATGVIWLARTPVWRTAMARLTGRDTVRIAWEASG
jgi:hypothetical protein